MNILFVTHYTELYGANRSLLNLVQGLQNRGMRFFLIAPSEGEVTNEFQKLGGKPIVFNFPKIMNPESRDGNNLSNAKALFRIVPQILPAIAQLSIDLIYSNSSVIGLGHWLSAFMKVPHITHIREFGDLDYDVYPDFGKDMFREILGASSSVISISEAVRKHVFPIDRENSYVVSNGVIGESMIAKHHAQPVNEKDTIDIAMLGLIIPKKGHLEALSAFAKAEDYDPRLRLNIYGSGNPNFENKLKQFALDNNISHKVIFHGRTNDPLKALAESDICLVCSEAEGFGRVTAEAMAMQCPVIARNSGANAELITHRVNGLLYNDEDELSEMIIDLGRDADLHEKLANNGLASANENFTIEKYSQNIYNIMMKSMNEFNINKSIDAMSALLKVIERMRNEGLVSQAKSAFDSLINMYSNELGTISPNYVNYGFENISKLIQDLQSSPKAKIVPLKQSSNTRMNLIDQFADQILSGTGAYAASQTPTAVAEKDNVQYKVSALVSVYSSREHIKGCLEDLTNQTLFKNGEMEIIIIDAASPENEIEIIKPYLDAHTQIKYTRTNERISVYQAWNLTAKMASGKYLTNANTDDRHREDALEIMADYLDNHSDIALVYSDIIVTYYPNETFDSYHDCGYMKRPEYSPEIMLSGCHIGPMPMWRKSVHNEIGYFDEQLISAGDYEFWCRIALKNKLHHIAIALGLYYSNPNGIENSNQTLSIREAEMIKYKYANLFPQPNGSYQNNLLRMENECLLIEKAKSEVFPESRNAHKHLDGLRGLEINASAHNPFGLQSKYIGLTDTDKIAEQERVAGYHVKFDIVAFGDELPLPDESEDYVLSAHVVEHFPNLIKVLVEWFRVIKQGGIMYMMVPNRDTVYSDSLKPLTEWNHVFDDYINQMTIAKEPLFENPKHYHVFTLETLQAIIARLFGDRMVLIDSAAKDDKMGSGFTLVYRKVKSNSESLPWAIAPWPDSAEICLNSANQDKTIAKGDNSDYINIGMVTYNRLDFTTQAIDALIKNADYPYKLSVVDNGSTDGTREYLKNHHSKGVIKNLVLLDENVGVAKASNLAWNMEPEADFYMKLDNDIVIEKTPFLSTMVELLDTFPALFMTGYNFEPISYPMENVEGYNLRIKESGNLGGACVMIPRRTRELIGVWSEDYGLYGEEDADYCYRVRLAGGVIAYCEDENIGLHLPGGKAAVIDPLTFEAEDSSETEIHGDYRRWKDEQRKRNVLLGLYHSIIDDYNAKRKPIKQESRFAKEYFSRHNVVNDVPAIVTIIIPVFNKLEYTKPCIDSIYKIGSKYKFDIIVVDNGSTDGTDEYLRNMAKEHSNFKFIRNEKNMGFAKACNAGIAASKAKYSLLLNNDIIVLENWLDALIDSADRDNDIAVAGSLLFYPGGEIIQHCGVRIGLWQGHLMPFHEHKMRDIRFVPSALQSGETNVVTGACMLLRNSDIQSFGALDENYINSFEDVDLCLRMRQAGKKVYYCAESKLIHYESMTSRRHDNDMQNLTLFNQKWNNVFIPDIDGQDFQRAIWSVWLREEVENNPDDIAKFNDFIKFLYAVGYAEEAEFILRSRGLDPDKVVEKITSTSENRNANSNNQQNEPKELAFIIPLHDNLNYTRDCLDSIRETCGGIDYEVVFVDNASSDGTKEYLQDLINGDNRIKAVFNNDNMAYSIANNLGAKQANADYLVFLNNDTKLLKDCIQSILYTFRNDEAIGVQGAKLLYPNDTVQHAGIVWGPVSEKLNLHYHIYLTFPREADCVNVAREHQFVTGALLAICSELFQTVGGFDERYYFGHEDLDLCMKVRSEGKKVWYNPYAEAYHFESITKKTEGIEKFERFITHPDSNDAKNHKQFLEKWENYLANDADDYYYSDGMLAFVSSAREKQEYIERVENLKNVFDSLRIENDRTLIDRLAKIILGPAINKPNPQISLGYISDSRLTQAEIMLGIRPDNSIEDYLSILDPNYVPMNNEETITDDFAAYNDDSITIEEPAQETIAAEADFVAFSETENINAIADEDNDEAESVVPLEMDAVIDEPLIEKSEEPIENTLFDFTDVPDVPEIPFDEVSIEKAKPKKILMTMYGWNESGGGTTFPKSFAKGLVRAGFQVAVVYATHEHPTVTSPYYVETSNDDGVELYGIYNRPTVFLDSENPKREIRDDKICEIFERIVDNFQPDIVHFHNFLGLSFAIVDIAKGKGVPTIFTPYNYHLIDPRLYMYRSDLSIWQTRDFQMESELTLKYPHLGAAYAKRTEVALDLLNSKLDYTFAVSRRVREIFMEFGANPDRIQVVNQVHDTIDPLIGQSKPFDGTPLRFGFIGGVMPHKGVHTIVQAAQLVPEGSAEFYVYGFASESYIELLRSIDRKSRVKIMGEYQSSDLGSIAQNLSAMILPSIWEDCAPFVITESLAMGLPVIGARIGGFPDFIRDDYNGWLYAYNSPTELAGVISGLASNPSKLQSWQSNCHIPLTFKDHVDHVAGLYNRIASGEKLSNEEIDLYFDSGL